MSRRLFGSVMVLVAFAVLGSWAPSRSVAQDCGGYGAFYSGCAGTGEVILSSPLGFSGGGCSGGGSSGGYAMQSYYWPAVYYQQPIYAAPSYAAPSYAAPYYGRSRYVERWRTPFESGVYRSRGRWVCGPSGCYLEE